MKADSQNTTTSYSIDTSYAFTIAGINGDYDDYLNKYTSKELQTGEFDPMVSTGLEMLDFGSRFYDPQLGRWFTPDPAEQFANPYLAMGNNPVVYVDPDGEWVHLVVGAVIGGFSGWQMGKANDAKGWKMFGYIVGGAAIGAASGGAAGAVSSAGGGAFISGAVGGAVGNGGFAALGGGNAADIAKGVGIGFISGGVGGSFGAAIGGGGGAFAGGAVGSGLNAKLHGASWKQVGISALAGGGLAFGTYHASSYLNYQFRGGNSMGGHDISYKQYTAMQADFQRSRFWGKEYGGYLLEGGGIHRVGSGSNSQIDLGTAPDGAFAEYHTHWDKPGLTRYTLHGGDGSYVDPQQIAQQTPVGQRVAIAKFQTSRYHSSWDYNTGGRPSYVINRYDGSYYSGSGSSYSKINPPISRFTYSFWFWR